MRRFVEGYLLRCRELPALLWSIWFPPSGWFSRISRRARVAYLVHSWTGLFAWTFANPGGPQWGIALRIDHTRRLWRLQDWAGDQWTGEWVRAVTENPWESEVNA